MQFEELLALIAPYIEKDTFIREPIDPAQRLLLTLRYLASGDSMMSMKYQYYIAQPTISKIINETCDILWTVLMPIVLKIPSYNEWKKIAEGFKIKCDFPHCLGAVDGKHVIVQAPPNAGSSYYNYKSAHSIVLLAICDSNYKFILVDIGAEGRQSDGGIWIRSNIGQAFSRGNIDIPPPDRIFEGPILPYVLVADEAFQLTNNWRIYRRPINTSLETGENIVKATIVLHNFLRQNNDNNSFITSNTENNIESFEMRAEALENINNVGSNTNTREASEIRNSFTLYFNTMGAIPSQEAMI
ncbi:uncharacterized protein LOC105194291 [Solenopsis invicta]|uniref:uncharacterized protein LOC105194291 n=1 Tax=Solenopsis invicta TaxID=13686 RepID=UPI00193CFC22|nr:uncharacterized protein LOC105194291 [Solenopsis invicta]